MAIGTESSRRASAQIVLDVAEEFGRPFTVTVYPNGDHGLRDVDSASRYADLLGRSPALAGLRDPISRRGPRTQDLGTGKK